MKDAFVIFGVDPDDRPERSLRIRQGFNRRIGRCPAKVTFNGITDSWRGWGSRLGLAGQTLIDRYRKGWPLHEVLSSEKHADGRPRRQYIFDAPPPLPPRRRGA